jgi:hypothetical protein
VKNKTISRLALSVGALSVVAYACGGGGDTGVVTDLPRETGATGGSVPTITGGSGSGGSAAPGSGGTGGGTIGAGGGIIVTSGGSAGSPPIDEDTACGTGMASASLKPVNMFVVFDRSSSMLQCGSGMGGGFMGGDLDGGMMGGGMMGGGENCTDGPTRWELAATALTQFFQDPGAADLGVALRFYPHDLPAAGCVGDMGGFGADAGTPGMGCDINACAMPLVDMGVLKADPAPVDTHEAALVNAVMASAPGTESMGTPTFVALSGAAQWSLAYQQAHPEQRTVIVLVTDGQPNGCSTNIDDIAAVAADALATADIRTYAIGLAVGADFLNTIAMAGGTDQAFVVNDGATATADLLAALNAIRGMSLACDFPVPASTTSGMAIDPTLINVNFTSTAGTEVELGMVGSEADCGTQQAWYYDNPAMPTRIILCPESCTTVTGDLNASIEILAGCKPRPPEVK